MDSFLASRFATADAVDDPSPADVLGWITPRFSGMALDQQKTAPTLAVSEGYKEATSISGEHVEPKHGNVTDAGVDNNCICWLISTKRKSVGNDDGCLRPGNKIASRSLRQGRIDLNCCYAATRTDNLCKDSAVVAGAGTDVHDMASDREVEEVKKFRPQAWLTIINASLLVECDQRVVINVPRVGIYCRPIVRYPHWTLDAPRPRPNKAFPRYCRKGIENRLGCDVDSEPQFFRVQSPRCLYRNRDFRLFHFDIPGT